MNQSFKTPEYFHIDSSLENNSNYPFFPQSSSSSRKVSNILPYSLINEVSFQRSENSKSSPRTWIQAEAGSDLSSSLAPSFARIAYVSGVLASDRSIFYEKARTCEDPISMKSSLSGKSSVPYDKSFPYPIFT